MEMCRKLSLCVRGNQRVNLRDDRRRVLRRRLRDIDGNSEAAAVAPGGDI
jgi:hypothetical protein